MIGEANAENPEEEHGEKIPELVFACDNAGKRKSWTTEGGLVPMGTGKLLEKYLPATFGLFMGKLSNILLKKILKSDLGARKAEPLIPDQNRIQDSFSNVKRQFIFVFRCPASKRYYITFLSYMFTKYFLQLVWNSLCLLISAKQCKWTSLQSRGRWRTGSCQRQWRNQGGISPNQIISKWRKVFANEKDEREW